MTSANAPFVVGTATLRGRTGSTREVRAEGTLAGIATSVAHVRADRPVSADLVLEAVPHGVMAVGTVRAVWIAECRRCLEQVSGEITVPVKDLFEERPTEGESYPLGHDEVDLEPMVRDALFLELPLAPLCRDDCGGPDDRYFARPVDAAGAGRPDDPQATRRGDPRWAALDEMTFEAD